MSADYLPGPRRSRFNDVGGGGASATTNFSPVASFTPYFFAEWAPGGVYHVYNRAVHRNRLFLTRSDHFKFIALVLARLSVLAELFSYALVLNHFHLSCRLPTEDTLRARLEGKHKLAKPEAAYLRGERDFNQLYGFYFGNAIKAYAHSFNRRHGRRGTLFDQTLRRIRTRNDVISRRLIMYHHTNEMNHGLADAYDAQRERSSFEAYDEPRTHHAAELLATAPVLERFGGWDAMAAAHERYQRRYRHDLKAFDERKYFGYGQPQRAEAPVYPWLG